MGLSLSEYRCKTLFSLADKDGSHVLDSHEFEVALGLLREEVSATYVPLSLSRPRGMPQPYIGCYRDRVDAPVPWTS